MGDIWIVAEVHYPDRFNLIKPIEYNNDPKLTFAPPQPQPLFDVAIALVDAPKVSEPLGGDARDFMRRHFIGATVRFSPIFGDRKGHVVRTDSGDDAGLLLLRQGYATLRKEAFSRDRSWAARAEEEEALAIKKGIGLHSVAFAARPLDFLRVVSPPPTSPAEARLQAMQCLHVQQRATVERVLAPTVFEVVRLPSLHSLDVTLCGIRSPIYLFDHCGPDVLTNLNSELLVAAKRCAQRHILHRTIAFTVEEIDETASAATNFKCSIYVTLPNDNGFVIDLLRSGIVCLDPRTTAYCRNAKEMVAAARDAMTDRRGVWSNVDIAAALKATPERFGVPMVCRVREVLSQRQLMVMSTAGNSTRSMAIDLAFVDAGDELSVEKSDTDANIITYTQSRRAAAARDAVRAAAVGKKLYVVPVLAGGDLPSGSVADFVARAFVLPSFAEERNDRDALESAVDLAKVAISSGAVLRPESTCSLSFMIPPPDSLVCAASSFPVAADASNVSRITFFASPRTLAVEMKNKVRDGFSLHTPYTGVIEEYHPPFNFVVRIVETDVMVPVTLRGLRHTARFAVECRAADAPDDKADAAGGGEKSSRGKAGRNGANNKKKTGDTPSALAAALVSFLEGATIHRGCTITAHALAWKDRERSMAADDPGYDAYAVALRIDTSDLELSRDVLRRGHAVAAHFFSEIDGSEIETFVSDQKSAQEQQLGIWSTPGGVAYLAELRRERAQRTCVEEAVARTNAQEELEASDFVEIIAVDIESGTMTVKSRAEAHVEVEQQIADAIDAALHDFAGAAVRNCSATAECVAEIESGTSALLAPTPDGAGMYSRVRPSSSSTTRGGVSFLDHQTGQVWVYLDFVDLALLSCAVPIDNVLVVDHPDIAKFLQSVPPIPFPIRNAFVEVSPKAPSKMAAAEEAELYARQALGDLFDHLAGAHDTVRVVRRYRKKGIDYCNVFSPAFHAGDAPFSATLVERLPKQFVIVDEFCCCEFPALLAPLQKLKAIPRPTVADLLSMGRQLCGAGSIGPELPVVPPAAATPARKPRQPRNIHEQRRRANEKAAQRSSEADRSSSGSPRPPSTEPASSSFAEAPVQPEVSAKSARRIRSKGGGAHVSQ